MNKKTKVLSLLVFGTLLLTSCGGKKDNGDIIAPKPVEKHSDAILSIQNYHNTSTQNWGGNTYSITVTRTVDRSLPVTEDENGQKYYDNKINLLVKRSDGSVFLEKIFSKSDFSEYITGDYGKKGALLGVVFDKIDGGNLKFGASIGSPDKTSDEYIPFVVTISRSGSVSISKDTQMDTGSDVAPQDEQDDSN